MPKTKKTDDAAPEIAEAEPETSGEITVTVDPTDTPPHTATGPGESVVDPGNGGRCW